MVTEVVMTVWIRLVQDSEKVKDQYVDEAHGKSEAVYSKGGVLHVEKKTHNGTTVFENLTKIKRNLCFGIVYLTGLFLLTPLTYLTLDWINFGTIKILEHSCREPEIVVKLSLIHI